MSYLDLGFTSLLSRGYSDDDVVKQLDPQEFDQVTQEISGTKITGQIVSSDGKMLIDLINSRITFNDGVGTRVEIGKILDDFGIKVYTRSGDVVLDIEEGATILGDVISDSSINFAKIDLSDFLEVSEIAANNAVSLPNNTVLSIAMTLTLNKNIVTLAIPRWSIYVGSVSDATEVVGPSNTIQENFNARSFQRTRNNGVDQYKHIQQISCLNVSGSTQSMYFRGDWIYFGQLRS